MALDAVEQERRAFCHAGRNFRDGPDLMARIGAVNAPQRRDAVDLVDKCAKVLVGHERCSGCRNDRTNRYGSLATHSRPSAAVAGKISDLITTATAPELSSISPMSM